MMATTRGEKESTGGEPTPTNSVLRAGERERERERETTRHQEVKKLKTSSNQKPEDHGPAEEPSAVVERFPCEAEAHVESERVRFRVKRSDQSGRCQHSLAALRPGVRMAARRGVLQSRISPSIRHRLPLDETLNVRAAVRRRDPLRHLRGRDRKWTRDNTGF
ncbi:hypothetical protein F2P81_022907 [Scophthalmus maximus]|uniref:Uncharacterized protein n=1 Tax=Scophthalmus maximus TaxID=52904 RepID=A0A6A4RV57_SCOMX|nr:hypothetical protein F2P81_022907 [Scophthalmus maximus]